MQLWGIFGLLVVLLVLQAAAVKDMANKVHQLEKPFFEELESRPGPWVIQLYVSFGA